MKAVIMAGGEGSRLRPLTCNRPKPMVPVLDRPVMEYAVGLLRNHGIHQIGVTLQYLPEPIMEYFGDGSAWGVQLQYFIENEPLGTAGSVKNTGDFLDEPFIVISGDALTDLDLTQAMNFHRQKSSMATLVLKSVEYPLEYGVVMTDNPGRITRFLEKPSWGEVFSDTVNTGIYILDPVVMNLVPANKMVDFSKDVFPQLLKAGKPIFGYIMDGYWCDIGNHEQYRQAQEDFLAGKIRLPVPGDEVEKGVYIEPKAFVHPDAKIEGPVFIGQEAHIEQDAVVGPGAVIGAGARIAKGASVKRSILWERAELGSYAQIRGAVLCNQARLGSNVDVYEGAIIGERVRVGSRGQIRPGIKIWPQKDVEDGVTLNCSLIWGSKANRNLFGPAGVSGEINNELIPELLTRLGAAFGSCLSTGAKVVIGDDGHPAANFITQAFSSGLQSTGVHTIHLGSLPSGALRFGLKTVKAEGGVMIRTSSRGPDSLTIEFFDHEGLHVSRGFERKVENVFAREDVRRVKWNDLGRATVKADMTFPYLEYLIQGTQGSSFLNDELWGSYPRTDWQRPKPLVVLSVISHISAEPARVLMERFGLTVQEMPMNESVKSWSHTQQVCRQLSYYVGEQRADFGVLIDGAGERLMLVDSQGQWIDNNRLLSLLVMLAIRFKLATKIPVPAYASEMVEAVAAKCGGKIFRTTTSLRSRVEGVEGSELAKYLQVDALAALTLIAFATASSSTGLESYLDDIPILHLHQRQVSVPWEARGKVMRGLMEASNPSQLELVDGIKLRHEEGWVLVLPDSRDPVCKVYSEAVDLEVAESLTEFYEQRVKSLANTPR